MSCPPPAICSSTINTTTATPSLNRDSPQILVSRLSGTLAFFRMPSTAMGSVGEINAMLDAARKPKSLVQVGQQQRSGAHWQSAIDFVFSALLGKCLCFVGQDIWSMAAFMSGLVKCASIRLLNIRVWDLLK